MSILWIDSIVFEKGGEIESFSINPLLIWANAISIVSFFLFYYFYRSNPQLQKAPSKLTNNYLDNLLILKMLSEFLLSLNTLMLLIGIKVQIK